MADDGAQRTTNRAHYGAWTFQTSEALDAWAKEVSTARIGGNDDAMLATLEKHGAMRDVPFVWGRTIIIQGHGR